MKSFTATPPQNRERTKQGQIGGTRFVTNFVQTIPLIFQLQNVLPSIQPNYVGLIVLLL